MAVTPSYLRNNLDSVIALAEPVTVGYSSGKVPITIGATPLRPRIVNSLCTHQLYKLCRCYMSLRGTIHRLQLTRGIKCKKEII